MIYRQGDVLLVSTDERPSVTATLRPRINGRIVLAYGEVTGHAHAIDDPLAELFEEKDGRLYLKTEAAITPLKHEEHAPPIPLPPRWYKVKRQREYHPAAIRPVAD